MNLIWIFFSLLIIGCGKKAEQNQAEKSDDRIDVRAMIGEYRQLQDRCRGGSGDDSNTIQACRERDSMFEKITAAGWCYGKEGQAEYEKDWHSCSNDKKDVNTPSKSANNSSSNNASQLLDMDWYAPNNITNECEKNEGPSKTIELLLALHKPYTATDEEVVAGTVTVVRIDIPEEGGGVRYLRGKDRCNAYVNAIKKSNKAKVDKYK